MKKIRECYKANIDLVVGDNPQEKFEEAGISLLESYLKAVKNGYYNLSSGHYIGFEIKTCGFDIQIILVEYEE
jgi:hypothetical protein